MLLAPHFLVGAAIVTYAPNAPLGLFLAFFSHYLLDQVPHWHYFPDAETAGPAHPLKKPIILAFASIIRPVRQRHVAKGDDFAVKTGSTQSGVKSILPLLRVGVDIAAGATLIFVAQPNNLFLVLLAGFLAMLPDGILLLSWQFPKNRLLAWHQSVHGALHITPANASALPLGIPLQLGAAVLAAFLISPLSGIV